MKGAAKVPMITRQFQPEEWWAYKKEIKYTLDASVPKVTEGEGHIAMQVISGPFSMLEGGEPYAAINPDIEEDFIEEFEHSGLKVTKIVWDETNA